MFAVTAGFWNCDSFEDLNISFSGIAHLDVYIEMELDRDQQFRIEYVQPIHIYLKSTLLQTWKLACCNRLTFFAFTL